MKNILQVLVLVPLFIFMAACSTTGRFKVPAGQQLMVTDRAVEPDALGTWKTSPFGWGGADYRLTDSSGKVVRSGKLKTKFRVASIFWPPFAIIYWPKGLAGEQVYDLTRAGDGDLVQDYSTNGAPSAAAHSEAPAAAPAKKAKGK
jgi:hypothetical protein